MFFALKLIRFVFRLLLKLVLFPFKIVKRLLGSGQSTEQWPAPGETETETMEATSETLTDSPEGLSVAAAQATNNIQWFRKGLIAVGVVQLLVGLFAVFNIAQSPIGGLRPALVDGLLLTVVVFSLAPIGIGFGLTRWTTASWYLGIAFCGLQIVLSLFALPGGFLTIAIYGILGYLGYTGRPALVTLSNAGGPPTEDESGEPASLEQQSHHAETAVDHEDTPSSNSEPAADGPIDSTVSSPTEQTDAPPADTTPTEPAPEPSANDEPEDTGDGGRSDRQSDPSETDAGETDSAEPETAADAVEEDPVEEYREELHADSASVRQSAVEDLVAATRSDTVPTQAAIDALSERLEDEDPEVRAVACRGLGQLGAEQVKPKLEDLRIDTDPDVSRAASQALRNIE
ncbi:HEAT repeat domain-containing protein [Halorientalis pallida]|uniref:HEAT repeat domain-containing protein n=1 Tax=Halorientalis pallida TaxID=2479928 RepID=UPI003C70167B